METPSSDRCLEACLARDAGDYRRMLRILRAGVAEGDDGCRFDLAYAYDLGLGLRTDKAEAMRLYRQVYRQGGSQATSAANNIATIYQELGRHRLALQWRERSAALGDGGAHLELAKHFLEGRGARRSVSDATRHLKAAITSKDVSAQDRTEAKRLLASIQMG